jgi:hypothetical protein
MVLTRSLRWDMRTFMARKVQADVPVLEIMGSLSLAQLYKKVASASKAVDLPTAGDN